MTLLRHYQDLIGGDTYNEETALAFLTLVMGMEKVTILDEGKPSLDAEASEKGRQQVANRPFHLGTPQDLKRARKELEAFVKQFEKLDPSVRLFAMELTIGLTLHGKGTAKGSQPLKQVLPPQKQQSHLIEGGVLQQLKNEMEQADQRKEHLLALFGSASQRSGSNISAHTVSPPVENGGGWDRFTSARTRSQIGMSGLWLIGWVCIMALPIIGAMVVPSAATVFQREPTTHSQTESWRNTWGDQLIKRHAGPLLAQQCPHIFLEVGAGIPAVALTQTHQSLNEWFPQSQIEVIAVEHPDILPHATLEVVGNGRTLLLNAQGQPYAVMEDLLFNYRKEHILVLREDFPDFPPQTGHRYKVLMGNRKVVFWGNQQSELKVQQAQKAIADYVGVIGHEALQRFFAAGRDQRDGNLRITFDPMQKDLQRHHITLITASAKELARDWSQRNRQASVIALRNVLMHHTPAERSEILDVLGQILVDGGFLLVTGQYPSDPDRGNHYIMYQRNGNHPLKVVERGELPTADVRMRSVSRSPAVDYSMLRREITMYMATYRQSKPYDATNVPGTQLVSQALERVAAGALLEDAVVDVLSGRGERTSTHALNWPWAWRTPFLATPTVAGTLGILLVLSWVVIVRLLYTQPRSPLPVLTPARLGSAWLEGDLTWTQMGVLALGFWAVVCLILARWHGQQERKEANIFLGIAVLSALAAGYLGWAHVFHGCIRSLVQRLHIADLVHVLGEPSTVLLLAKINSSAELFAPRLVDATFLEAGRFSPLQHVENRLRRYRDTASQT